MKLATIDVGTNTTLLLVADATRPEAIRVLADHAEITRLGRGIGGDGRLGKEGIERTLTALGEYARVARSYDAAIVAVGTEALRRAPNASDFLEAARATLGVPLEVIDGEREAALSFKAVTSSFPETTRGPLVVVDIGGGSTEVIVATDGALELRRSLPLGSVRLTEKHFRNDPPTEAEMQALTAELASTLAPLAFPPDATLVGVAGTVTSLAAMALGLDSYDPDRVHGFRLDAASLASLVGDLRRSTQADRETIPGLDPKRADVILAGACILLEIVRRVDVAEVLVSDRGIRWGLLYERIEART